MRIVRFPQHRVAGLHGLGTCQGSSPNQSQYVALYRIADLEGKKQTALGLATTAG